MGDQLIEGEAEVARGVAGGVWHDVHHDRLVVVLAARAEARDAVAGDLLADIEAPELDQQLLQAQSDLKNAETRIKSLKDNSAKYR